MTRVEEKTEKKTATTQRTSAAAVTFSCTCAHTCTHTWSGLLQPGIWADTHGAPFRDVCWIYEEQFIRNIWTDWTSVLQLTQIYFYWHCQSSDRWFLLQMLVAAAQTERSLYIIAQCLLGKYLLNHWMKSDSLDRILQQINCWSTWIKAGCHS